MPSPFRCPQRDWLKELSLLVSGLKKVRCPFCKRKITWENNPYRPFCSKECKLADLYSWLNEEYRIKLKEEKLDRILFQRSEENESV